MKFEFLQSPVTVNDIEEVENCWGLTLPSKLKEIVLLYNGAAVVGAHSEIESLISFSENDPVNIYQIFENWKNGRRKTLFPFAEDGGGNYYCLGYCGDAFEPSVVLLDHETSLTSTLASSFHEFWESMDSEAQK